MKSPIFLSAATLFFLLGAGTNYASADKADDAVHRIEKLEQELKTIRGQLEPLNNAGYSSIVGGRKARARRARVLIDSEYTYAMLDPTSAGKSKPLYLLRAKGDGRIESPAIYLGTSLIAMADYQQSNTADDFGYLMRQPGSNHVGKTASEIVIHSAQFQITANITPWISSYAEILYDPQQSFGAGSITALSRNQLQLRRAYVLLGNTQETPFYALIGKIDSPFGQLNTLNPFTLSTDWHSFSGLSYGALLGYADDRLNLSVAAVQGGAQFRGLNAPIDGTNTPSRVNNYVADASYKIPLGDNGKTILFGASYEAGSSFCQSFPITHFASCPRANPAFALYGALDLGELNVKGGYSQTIHSVPGTFNPNPPLNAYGAHGISSFDIGAKYKVSSFGNPLDISVDFSSLIAGPVGSPWRRQDQWVAGLALYPTSTIKVFAETVLVEGYLPLNFLTGGDPSLPAGETESSSHKKSSVFLFGIALAI